MKKLVLSLSAATLALGAGAIVHAQGEQDAPPRAGRDADRDGSVTRAEATAHAAAMFARFDANADGTIDAADRTARKAARFARLDADSNGEVTRAEMDARRAERRAKREERRAQRAERREERRGERFARLDADGSGGVSQAEMQAGREAAREARSERDGRKMRGHRRGGRMMGRAMLRMADADQDRSISRADFDAAVEQHFARTDADGNGALSRDERKAARQTMREAMQERRAARQPG